MSKIHNLIKSDKKVEVVHVQVAIPLPLYNAVKKLIDDSELSWQKVLLASIKAFQIECLHEAKKGRS